MKIIDPSAILVAPPAYNELLWRVENAGRTCYKSEMKEASAEPFVRNIIAVGMRPCWSMAPSPPGSPATGASPTKSSDTGWRRTVRSPPATATTQNPSSGRKSRSSGPPSGRKALSNTTSGSSPALRLRGRIWDYSMPGPRRRRPGPCCPTA